MNAAWWETCLVCDTEIGPHDDWVKRDGVLRHRWCDEYTRALAVLAKTRERGDR